MQTIFLIGILVIVSSMTLAQSDDCDDVHHTTEKSFINMRLTNKSEEAGGKTCPISILNNSSEITDTLEIQANKFIR